MPLVSLTVTIVIRVMRRLAASLICLAALGLPSAVHAAEGCAPAGGAGSTPATAAAGDFRFTGGGWGHGAGMSQYGAQGAALLGCDAPTILQTYFPGAVVQSVPLPSAIRVSLATGATDTPVTAVIGTIPWETCEGGQCTPLPVTLAAGRTWNVQVQPDASWIIRDGPTEVWRGGNRTTILRARLSLTDADNRIVRVGNRFKWGLLEFDSLSEATTTHFVTLDIAPFDRYLYGLDEVPALWPAQALQAQVIAARSYAALRRDAFDGARAACRCDVYATTQDQVYRGYEKEAEGPDGSYGRRWVDAVNATHSPDLAVGSLLRYQGKTADAYYSSSHGGYSESSKFVFGGELAYVQPVDDSRWDAASDNPYRTWTATFTADEVGAALGVGRATSITTPEPRGHACRIGNPTRGYGGLVVEGTAGRRVLSGDEVRRSLALRSTLFAVNADQGGGCAAGGPAGGTQGPPEPPPPSPTPSSPPPTSPPPASPSPSPDPVPPEPGAGPTDPVGRIAGTDRVQTAVAASQNAWASSEEALLATARGFPDALAAGALAARLDAPVLLTEPDGLPPEVLQELRRLRVRQVRILGGVSAISATVERTLRDAGFEIARLEGSERFATAAAVALAAGPSASGEVVLALGTDFADAVAAGALSATPDHPPTLLTARDQLPTATEQALGQLGARTVLVLGGESAISEAVARRLVELGYTVQRLSGPSRFDTSAAVARAAMVRFGQGTRPVILATGYGYPDALAAGALAAHLGAPLQLVHNTDLEQSPAARDFLREHAGVFLEGLVVGGPAAVAEQVREQSARAITG